MHHNYYFLRHLTKAIGSTIDGAVISECFSQSKDELILRFEVGTRSFVVRASLSPAFSSLSFPKTFQRARKNSVDLFQDIVARRVSEVRQFQNERSFAVVLSDGFQLLFKMHANRTNIILFKDGEVQELFRKNITADLNIRLDTLDRQIDWSFENFTKHAHDLRAVYFTFGKVVWRYLEDHGFSRMPTREKWIAVQEVLKLLNDPDYYITVLDEKPVLSLLRVGEIMKIHQDPLEAANEFFHVFTHDFVFTKEKSALGALLRSRLEAGSNYVVKNAAKLEEVTNSGQYKAKADVLMANLHKVKPGMERVVLNNFYDADQPLEIRLKKDLSPQKNAEVFYKKSKNQHIEIDRLQQSITQKNEELDTIRQHLAELESTTDLASVRALRQRVAPETNSKTAETLPYHEFHFRDYKIWVGKNAQANDMLTLKYGHKDDLWLHAKDVSGSHVLIKYQSGNSFPKDVIEYAASLAAYNSKRKNESLCPVIVTPKKFVRKRKGDPPGAMVVEREEVVMVEPLKPR